MLKDFRDFAIKGNVVDMAVGIIIGAAFTTVIKVLVDNVIMPPIGLLTGGIDFSDKFIVLSAGSLPGPYATLAKAKEAGATVMAYGLLINAVVSLLICAMVLFFIVRWIARLRRPDAAAAIAVAAPTTNPCPYCKSQIALDATRCPHCTSSLPA